MRVLGLDIGDRRIGGAMSDDLALIAQELARRDERLTTLQAERLLIGANQHREKRKARRDKITMQLMLQNSLDHQRARATRPSL